VTKPRNWVKADESPGGIIITDKQVLGRNPETSKNNLKLSGFHAILS